MHFKKITLDFTKDSISRRMVKEEWPRNLHGLLRNFGVLPVILDGARTGLKSAQPYDRGVLSLEIDHVNTVGCMQCSNYFKELRILEKF